MKKRRALLIFFCCLFLVTEALVGTQWGLRIAVHVVSSLSGGSISVGSVSGRIATKYELGDIRVATSGITVDIDSFTWSWKPLSLFKGNFEVLRCATNTVTVRLSPSPEEADERADSLALPLVVPPLHIILHDFSLRDVKILGSSGNIAFQIDSFDTSLEIVSHRLVVNQFKLAGPKVGMDFHGSFAFENDHNLDVMGHWNLVGYGFHPSKGTFSLRGPLNSLGVNVALNDPGEIRVTGVVTNLMDKPTWTADVDARNVNLETWIWHCPEIILKTVHGDMSGDFGHYRGLVEAEGFWGVADDLKLRSQIDGDAWGIVFNSLRIDRNNSSAIANNGSISWAELFSWEADLDVRDFVLSMFFPEFEGAISSTFHSVGDVTEAEGLVASFALDKMQGRFGEYDWSAAGHIGLTEDEIFSNDLILTSGTVGGTATVRHVDFSWLDKLSWKTVLDFDSFNPGFIHHELEGKINGHMSSYLEWQGDLPVGSFDIFDLTGELRGKDLYGGGTISLDGGGLSSQGFDITMGETSLHLQGELKDRYDLEFSFVSPDLSNIASGYAGALSIDGIVDGSAEEPVLDLKIQGDSIDMGKIALEKVDGEVRAGMQSKGAVDGHIVISNGSADGYSIRRFATDLGGTLEEHTFHTELQSDVGRLQFQLDGTYQSGWQGTLSGLSFFSEKYGDWTQQDVATAELSAERSLLENICVASPIQGDNGTGCISAAANLQEGTEWSVAVDFDHFALKPFGKKELDLPPLSGWLDGSIHVEGDDFGVQSAAVDLTIPKAETILKVTERDLVPVQVRDSRVSLDLRDHTLGANVFIKTSKGGTLSLKGTVDEFGLFATPLSDNTLAGEIVLDKYYLNSLAALTGYGVEPTGWVSSSLRLGGNLGQPEIYGTLAIQEGGVALPYQGITLEDVVVSVEANDVGTYVQAEAKSGGGRLNANGYITAGDEGLEATLRLAGEEFLLVNLPEYSFRVNPEADFTINRKRGQIDGRVVVPSGLIAPEELSGAVKVSEDVVFVGEKEANERKGFPFYLDLDVVLGEDVQVDGYGLKGRLAGDLNVKVTPKDFITGQGELSLLDSTFTFYGRSLDIERGAILFTGGPIDNPGVDIRAQKTVTAETARDDGYTVGVDLNGFVQDLQYHLFSDPYMDDTDILSQMVVGHSFANSSEEEGTLLQAAALTLGFEGTSKLMKGLGGMLLIDDLHLEGSTKKEDVSLVVGKRITKDLYIGYDMNMFSQLGQFRVRYDLTRGFYVETRSSSESTGADIIYMFER